VDLARRVVTRFQVRLAFQGALVGFGVKDLEHLSKKGRSFGVISAYRSNLSKAQNQERHGQLIADLQKLGIRNVETLKSQWDDMATGVTHKEKSIFIPHISFETLHKLGKKYDQDAVLYKDPSGSVGVYFKDGTATMAFDPKGEAAITKSEKPGEYSKGRGLSFGLQLVEDRKFHYSDKPISAEEIAKDLEKHPMKGSKVEEGAGSDWWKSQTQEFQKTYCQDHPNSGLC
jgi:Protein of unknown function (DUF3293)